MEKLSWSAVVTVVSAVVSVVAAAFTAVQARFAKRQAVAAEEQASAAKVQADLANAQLDQLKRSEGEEAGHKKWVEGILSDLRKPGAEMLLVKPGDQLHAQWALDRGYIEARKTSIGLGLILPASERAQIPGSPEAKIRAARREILTLGAQQPSAWNSWSNDNDPDWQTYSAAAEQLAAEGLVIAKLSPGAVGVRITNDGIAAARRGAF